MEVFEGILTRRSVRKFTADPVTDGQLRRIVEAGTWAPSGLNNQPWRFVLVAGEAARRGLAGLTRYGRIIEGAPAAIAVFLDREASYHDVKDHQGIGACIQNMLLAAHAMGLGACWLGEILNRAVEARELLGLPDRYELMAVVAVGRPAERVRAPGRHGVHEVVLGKL